MKDSPHVMDLRLHTESDKSQETAREDKKHHNIPPSSEPIEEIKTNKSNEEKRHNIKIDNAVKTTSPDKMKSNTIEMKDSVFPDRLDAHFSMTPATTDAVSSVFQIPYVQSLSEIDDGPWKDYSALELGGLTRSKEASADNKVILQKQKPPDTADRTTSLPPDHVAPPVPRETSDTEIYADGTSVESNNCEVIPKGHLSPSTYLGVPVKHKNMAITVSNNRARDDGEVNSDEREAGGQDYDQVPVRMRRLVNAKPVFSGVMTGSSAATPTPAGRTTSGELTHTKRSTKGPHSAGPEYALPWEDKKLDTLAPATTLGSVTPVTASSRSSSEPSSEIDSFSGARMSYTSEDINDEIGFGIGDRHKTKRLDPSSNTKPADKHRVYHQDGKKGNRLKAITSLFHRKKKDKKETDRNDDDSDDDKDDVTDDENVSESKKKKRDSEKSDHKKRKPEKPKKPEKLHKGNKTDRLSSEIDSEGLEMTSSDQTDREPLCRLIKINDDGSKVMEMIRPQSEPLGIFFKKGPETHREGLVVKSFLDKYAKRLFAGLLRVGDEIVEIDDDDICHLTLDEIKELIQQKERMILKLRATDYLT
ncbi:hypothetical protein Btru_004156 [Bulinus truncatus]|nr:hypothetical protein Btru_004156 [Bulinus truncatus]